MVFPNNSYSLKSIGFKDTPSFFSRCEITPCWRLLYIFWAVTIISLRVLRLRFFVSLSSSTCSPDLKAFAISFKVTFGSLIESGT